MKKFKKIFLISLSAILALSILGYIPIWKNDMEARKNREQVYGLVEIGDDLELAQEKLRKAGFRLMYDNPITPTIDRDYFQQLVIIGNTRPNFFETMGYTMQARWMPFTHSESPYVIISATLDGEITRIR